MNCNFSRYDTITERQLVLYHVPSAIAVPDSFVTGCRYFVAMLVWNARNLSVDDISTAARKLIDNGCAYVCCWGDDCDRVHDIFDQELIECELNGVSHGRIMTTWHTDDTIEEFIEFSLLHLSLIHI